MCTLGSCISESDSTKSVKVNTPPDIDIDWKSQELNYYSEKIVLISILKDIPSEITLSVLKDYLDMADGASYGVYEVAELEGIFDLISDKHNISRRKVALIVHAYKYDLLTQDEIITGYIDSQY